MICFCPGSMLQVALCATRFMYFPLFILYEYDFNRAYNRGLHR